MTRPTTGRKVAPAGATLLSREAFKAAVFERDGGECVLCTREGRHVAAQDAHHIIERKLWREPHQREGYLLDNGASVCGPCHILCEQTVVSVEELREACGIENVVVPSPLYASKSYTKWGDLVLSGGRRAKGELFYDESVQKILKQGGMLDLYTHLVPFPRTLHVSWSGTISDDDEVVRSLDHFKGREIVVTVKRDGQNNTVYPTGDLHARSPDAPPHADQSMARSEAGRWQFDIPEGWRVVVESLHRRHSIAYSDLSSWLLGIHVWADTWKNPKSGETLHNVCLPWDDTLEYFEMLGVEPVETIYRGPFDERVLRAIRFDRDRMEGWVVRDAGPVPYGQYGRMVAKYVRPDHNHLHGARHAAIITNELGPTGSEAPWRFDRQIVDALLKSGFAQDDPKTLAWFSR